MSAKLRIAAVGLIAIGSLQMIGDITGINWLRGIGLATGASPAPKVFTAQSGFETYANRFFVEWRDTNGLARIVEITPSIYRDVKGPYNRRNVYGAAFSYGPVLSKNPATRPMFESVLRSAFCRDDALVRELGINPADASSSFEIRLEPRNAGASRGAWPLNFKVSCDAK